MTGPAYALFDTPLGACGIAWNERGILLLLLPEGSAEETRAKVLERLPEAAERRPTGDAKRAVASIGALLQGERVDLSAIPLDMGEVSPFYRRVYEAARKIPPGRTLSYGEIASQLGSPGSARAVGQALGKNPFAIIVPCHRVLAAGGKMGGFSANGGVTTKRAMLSIEGAPLQTALFEGDGTFGFSPREAVETLRAADKTLGKLIDRVGPFRMGLQKTASIFTALTQAIVYQQLNGKAAKTIHDRVCALFPRSPGGPSPAELLRMSDEKLRGAGLSRNKLLALRDLAEKTQAGIVPTLAEVHAMDDETVIERLTEVRGIGRWTAEMLLMFRLGRPDVLALDDYGLRKGYSVAFRTPGLATKQELERRGERWKPYRTVACWYLWRAAELADKPKTTSKR